MAATDAALLAAISLPFLVATPPLYSQLLVFALPALLAVQGLYPGYGMARPARLRCRWVNSAAFFAGLLGLGALLPALALPPLALAITSLLFIILSPLTEDLIRHRLRRAQCWGKPALLLGSPEATQAMAQELTNNWALGLYPTLSSQRSDIDTIITSPGLLMTAQVSAYRHIYCVSHPCDIALRSHPHAPALHPHPARSPYRLARRAIDIVVGGLALVLALPLIGVFALLVYLTDRGSPFYVQPRSGQHGKRVKVWKIRSMYRDAEDRLQHLLATDPQRRAEWSNSFKLKNDPRILPKIGDFIRRHSIDELPQLWNVLRGEISLVGPRVFADYDLDIYTPEQLRIRQSVLPGVTGLWQVSGRSTGNNADKVRYDMAYLRNWSLWLDIDILYRTIGVVLSARGAV